MHNEHKYNYGYENKKTGYTMWRCINRFDQCNASNTINVIESTVDRASEHVCLSHHEQNVRDVVMDTCKKAVCETVTSPQSI